MWLLLYILSTVITYGLAFCVKGTFLNLCGLCVSDVSRSSEGMDRCGVCGGDNTCVGCDGVINSGYKTDICGQCLQPDDAKWNDCRLISSVYPAIVDQALNNHMMILSVRGAGLRAHNAKLNNTNCFILSKETKGAGLQILESSKEENDLELKVQMGRALGRFDVTCEGVAGSASLTVVNSSVWSTVDVTPVTLNVDDTYQLTMVVSGASDVSPVWCVLRCEALPTRVLPGRWVTPLDQVQCSDFTPRFAGRCVVGVAASEDAASDPESSNAKLSINVVGSAPYITSVELNPDLGKLLVRFNANIQLTSPCEAVFSQRTNLSLDSSRCLASGDILAVGLKPDHPLLEIIDVVVGNGVRRMGTRDPQLAPECAPITLPVSAQKVLPPNLSLQVPSIMCDMRSEELHVSSIGEQRVKYTWSVPPPAVSVGTQRDNLILWEMARRLQSHLNDNNGLAHINSAELVADAPYSINVLGTNALGDKQRVSSALKFSPSAPISVMVSAPPAVSALLAEVNVTLCAPTRGPFTFRWYLDGVHVHGAGRVVLMSKVPPGRHNVSCVVKSYVTSEILATGWVMTQVLPSDDIALITPAEQVVGTMDVVTMTVFAPYREAGVWVCTTPEGYPCYTPGPGVIRVDEMVENNVTVLKIPPGSLPVGKYIWRVSNTPSTHGVVIVRGGIPPQLHVTPVPPLVNPMEPLVINAEARRLHADCSLQWSTVFRRGFNYFNLQEDVGLGDTLRIEPDENLEAELPLLLPTAHSTWSGLKKESSYLLRMTVTCPSPAGSAYVNLPVTVNVPPTVTPIRVDQMDGVALISEFTVHGGAATEIMYDYPLQYIWGVVDEDKQAYLVDFGSSARDVRLRLPPGRVTVSLQVCDLHVTCTGVTTSTLTVTAPPSVSDGLVRNLREDITNLMLEGSTVLSLGKAIVAIKTLNSIKTAEAVKQLREVMDTLDDAVVTRCRDLKLELQDDSTAMITSLEFLRLVLDSLRHVTLSQLTRDLIVDLKDSVTDHVTPHMRVRRDVVDDANKPAVSEVANLAIQTMEKMYEIEPSVTNRDGLLSEVKKQMALLCRDHTERSSTIQTAMLDLWVSGKIQPTDQRRLYTPSKGQVQVTLNQDRSNPQCLAIATMPNTLFDVQKSYIVGSVYEVEVVTSEGVQNRSTSVGSMVTITIPTPGVANTKLNCYRWQDGMWQMVMSNGSKKGEVSCRTRDFGYFSVISSDPLPTPAATTTTTTETTTTSTMEPTTTSTTESTTTSTTISTTESTTTSTTESTTTSTTESTTETTSTSTTEPTTTSTTTEAPSSDVTTKHAEKNEEKSEVKVRTLKTAYYGAQFTVIEDYDQLVVDQIEFERDMTSQIAETVKVKPQDIVVSVAKGSILVTVYMLVSMEEERARDVYRELARLVRDGDLHLTSHGRVLDIPHQNLTLIQKDDSQQAQTIYTVTIVVVGAVVLLVIVLIYMSGRRREGDAEGVHGGYGDPSPMYLNFDNDYSLDGSEASLAQYRRQVPLTFDSISADDGIKASGHYHK